MTNPQNPLLPYASPMPLASQGDLFRLGPTLIARDRTTLPPRCILCNQPASPQSQPIPLKFSWDASFKVTHSPSTLELRRAGSIRAYLCSAHHSSWRTGRRIGITGMIASTLLMLAATIAAILAESANIPRYSPHAIFALLAAFALFIAFLFLYTLKTRTLTCTKIDQGYLHLQGAHENFLASLPALPGKVNGN